MEPYMNAREDLADLIACETSGLTGAFPEQDDYDLAEIFIAIINEDWGARDQMTSVWRNALLLDDKGVSENRQQAIKKARDLWLEGFTAGIIECYKAKTERGLNKQVNNQQQKEEREL